LEINMKKQVDNIELRSERVRNIIGLIPPSIIRIGMTLIFLIIIGILVGTYFFEYEYSIKTSAIVGQQNDTTIFIVKIPANEILKVKKGHLVVMSLDKDPNLYNERIRTVIQTNPDKIVISAAGGYYFPEIKQITPVRTETGKEMVI